MIGIDTNILVRYLTEDDPEQSRRATSIIHGALKREQTILLSCIVLSELVWVLESAYGIPEQQVLDVVERLLEAPQLELEDRDAVRQAIADSRQGLGDLVDSLIGRRNEAKGCSSTATFDRALKGHPAFSSA